jgi:hypothetical protein
MNKYKLGDRVWIVPYRLPDGGLSTGLVVPLPADYRPCPHHPAETVLAVRLDQHEGDPRLFYEADLRPVARS